MLFCADVLQEDLMYMQYVVLLQL